MSQSSSDPSPSDTGTPMDPEMQTERAELAALADQPLGARCSYYLKRSGPGWLQGAITLGGGSLAGAMYLGVIAGFGMMWLQPLAMILGVIMLSAIAYVTLSTEQRPFRAINENVSPALGWAWLIAAGMANIVWCMPQFNLARASIQQNLMGMENADVTTTNTVIICLAILALALFINFLYMRGAGGLRAFEIVLKIMVAVVVLAFFGVVLAVTINGTLPWGQVLKGLIPDLSLVTRPADAFLAPVAATGAFAEYWTETITSAQRDRMITAFGTAVGINMTFILPYSMLRKRWGKEHRGLAIFDLAIGLIIPFVLATGCVVIAAASQFHGQTGDVLEVVTDESGITRLVPRPAMENAYFAVVDRRLTQQLGQDAMEELRAEGNENALADARLTLQLGEEVMEELQAEGNEEALADARATVLVGGHTRIDDILTQRLGARAMAELREDGNEEALADARSGLPEADRTVAAMLANRDNMNLAQALEPLTGRAVAQVVFGIGVLGMAVSTIIMLMLISGYVFCEALNRPGNRMIHLCGTLVAGIGGFMGPFIWGNADARAALAVPTSVIGGAMIPIAYMTFLLLMNSRSLLGDKMPTGMRRVRWNVLMVTATTIATIGCVWVLWGQSATFFGLPAGRVAIAGLAVLLLVGVLGFLSKQRRHARGL